MSDVQEGDSKPPQGLILAGMDAEAFGLALESVVLGIHATDIMRPLVARHEAEVAWRPDGKAVLTVRVLGDGDGQNEMVAFIADLDFENGRCVEVLRPLRRSLGFWKIPK